MEKILRLKIYDSLYWKEDCFGLTAETLVDKAMLLDHIGGTFGGNRKPTHFICLILKMLQIQPDPEIILEFIKNEDYKYVRALGVYYLRLIGRPIDVYNHLEPIYNDFRKLRYRSVNGWKIIHMDEFIDDLLKEKIVCDVTLPPLIARTILEDRGELGMRKSILDEDDDEENENKDNENEEDEVENENEDTTQVKQENRIEEEEEEEEINVKQEDNNE